MPSRWTHCKRLVAVAALSAFLMAVAACAGAAEPAATIAPQPAPTRAPIKLSFMAGYKPQANLPFVAAYVAHVKGFFREQGLEVEITHSYQGQHLRLLLANEIQVTTGTAESVLKRVADPGAPIVALALFGQKGDQGFAVLENSGIKTPKDWEGKTVGYKITQSPDYLAILRAAGVDRSKIKEVSVGFDPRVLTEKRVDVYPVFVSNEPNLLAKLGFPVRVFTAADYGVPTLGLTYITTQSYLASNKEALARFVKATMRALSYIDEHFDEAVDIVMRYAPDEDRAHQSYMLKTELAEALSPLAKERGLGWMTLEQWQALHDQLIAYQALKKPVDVSTVFTDEFLRQSYDAVGKLRWP